jgi:hypothetical protein
MNRFSWNSIFESFTNICRHVPIFVKILQQYRAIYTKTCIRSALPCDSVGNTQTGKFPDHSQQSKINFWETSQNCCSALTFPNLFRYHFGFLMHYNDSTYNSYCFCANLTTESMKMISFWLEPARYPLAPLLTLIPRLIITRFSIGPA